MIPVILRKTISADTVIHGRHEFTVTGMSLEAIRDLPRRYRNVMQYRSRSYSDRFEVVYSIDFETEEEAALFKLTYL